VFRRTPIALIALLLAAATTAWSQPDEGILIDLHRTGARKVRVELRAPEVISTLAEAETGAARLATRLVRDLVYSGVLALVEPLPVGIGLPADVPNETREGAEDDPADALLALRLEGERTEALALTARLLSPGGQNLIVGKRYVVDLSDPGPAVHHFADQVVYHLTGEPGIARTRILFSRGDRERREIYIVDYDGENLRQVTRNRSLNLAPRWSPDGGRVCYTSYHGGRQRLLILDGGTGRSSRITDYPGLNVGAGWAPGGDELVVTLSRDGNAELYRIDAQGEIRQRLTRDPSIECSPDFDPTGRWIVYTSDRTGVPQIYVMDREGANRRRLTFEGRYNDSAAWSPRGDRIAFVSRVDGRFQVFTIEPDGSNLQQITFARDGNNEDPSWAPDGRHVVVSSDRAGEHDLWVIDVESRVARALTRGGATDTGPDWSGIEESTATAGESK
jgi:TolB protein